MKRLSDFDNVLPFYSHTREYDCLKDGKEHWSGKGVDSRIFSNLWLAEIEVQGETFACTEAYFQAQKFEGGDLEFMRRLRTGRDAAAFGQRRMKVENRHLKMIDQLKEEGRPYPQKQCRDGSFVDYVKGDRVNPVRIQATAYAWDSMKKQVMYEALVAKFTQHEDLKRQLLATGDATLIEHTKNDAQWGDGGDGSGRNFLGKMLMLLRSRLQAGKAKDQLDLDEAAAAHFEEPMANFIQYD